MRALYFAMWRLDVATRATKKVIQVPIDDELLSRIDETVGRVAQTRAAFIREALPIADRGPEGRPTRP